MNNKITDLGWENAGGETSKTIDKYREVCDSLKHHPQRIDQGCHSTMHSILCEECSYVYHYDSGD